METVQEYENHHPPDERERPLRCGSRNCLRRTTRIRADAVGSHAHSQYCRLPVFRLHPNFLLGRSGRQNTAQTAVAMADVAESDCGYVCARPDTGYGMGS